MNQLSFFDLSSSSEFADLAPHIVNNFWAFHQENPQVFELFKRFTEEMRGTGRKRYGVKSIAERIRWHFATTSRSDEFKMNNNYVSCYARLLILNDPELKDFFQTRESRAA